ncbi:unnamed protein product, partial [Porites evermanni]
MTDNNCTLFKDQQHYCTAIYAVKQVVSSLELVGSLFIIFIIWLFKTYKYFNQRLILALSVAALGESISILMVSNSNRCSVCCVMYPYIFHLFCSFIQKWSLVLGSDIESAIDNIPIKSFQKKSTCMYFFIIIIIIFVFALFEVPWPVGSLGWIAGDVENSAIWRMATYYIPLFICIIGLFTVCLFILITHRRQAQRWQGVYSRNNATEHQQRQLWMRDVKSLMAYPLIYLLLSLAPFIHR